MNVGTIKDGVEPPQYAIARELLDAKYMVADSRGNKVHVPVPGAVGVLAHERNMDEDARFIGTFWLSDGTSHLSQAETDKQWNLELYKEIDIKDTLALTNIASKVSKIYGVSVDVLTQYQI